MKKITLFIALFLMAAVGVWAQEADVDEAAGKVIGRKMSRVAGALQAMEGVKVEAINDDSGLPAVLVTFDAGIVAATGSNEPTAAAKTQLSKLATVLLENKAVVVEVLGHSDNSKWRNATAQQSVQRNLELSERRARVVVDYLKTRGVPDEQFRLVEGKGDRVPVADNATTDGRAANRRVEVFLLAGDRMIAEAIAASRPPRHEPETASANRQVSNTTEQSPARKAPKASTGQEFNRGDIMLFARTSGVDLSITSVSGYSSTDFSIEAGAGYFVIDRLAITGELQIGVSKVTDTDASTSFGLGFGARYYIVKGFYAGARVGGMKASGVDDIQGAFALEAGYDLFLSDYVFIEPALQLSKGVNFSHFKVADGITFGLSLGIGVKF